MTNYLFKLHSLPKAAKAKEPMKIETIPDAVVATPPAWVVAASVAGVPIETWVLWLNLFYILLAVGWKLWSIYKESRNGSSK